MKRWIILADQIKFGGGGGFKWILGSKLQMMRMMYVFQETTFSITKFLFHALLVRLRAHYEAKSKVYAVSLLPPHCMAAQM